MTTITSVVAGIRARLEANVPTYSQGGSTKVIGLRWQGESGGPLPNTPQPFAWTAFVADQGRVAGFGGGRGANLYRHAGQIEAYVFVPLDWGADVGLAIAEQYAALFRSHRDATMSCFDATVDPGGPGSMIKPPGLDSEVEAYWYCGVLVSLFYDQIG
ncbi:MAG: hypothetical protein KIS96_03480 [Bauldia sp.]|nr:hypothetical protein [Bauldia sp.]